MYPIFDHNTRWNPFMPGYKEAPHLLQNFLREQAPVHKGINNTWMLFRYHDVKLMFSDERFANISLNAQYQQKASHFPQLPRLKNLEKSSTKWLLFTNPPEHTALRKLVTQEWNKIKVTSFIESVIDESMEHLKKASNPDLVKDFAFTIPVKTILHVLGLPQQDLYILKEWARHMIQSLEPFESMNKLALYDESAGKFYAYFANTLIEKRRKPDDFFISGMIVENELEQVPMTDNELISVFILVFFAGIETSVYLIAQSMYHLLNDEYSLQWLRQNTQQSHKAIEELIRFSSPSQYAPREAAADFFLHGVHIKKGEKIMGCIASANRDPRIFDNPDSLQLDRQKNPHLGFGYGIHHCIGAKLAREEMNRALPALLHQFSSIQFRPNHPPIWDTLIINRGLQSLPVTLSR